MLRASVRPWSKTRDCHITWSRNEQAMVHTASAFAKTSNRMRTMVCTTFDRPWCHQHGDWSRPSHNQPPARPALPGDIFAQRHVAPVLQQLESSGSQDVSVNDCFKPVSRYWDRIQRPEQILTALPAAMRVLTSPAETGAVVLGLPQDVQAEAFDYPEHFFREAGVADCAAALRWPDPEQRSTMDPLRTTSAAWWQAAASSIPKPALRSRRFAAQTGIPVVETQAGKGSLSIRSSARTGCGRRDGYTGGKYSGAGSRSDYWGRHALQRLHDGFADRISKSGGKICERECERIRRR